MENNEKQLNVSEDFELNKVHIFMAAEHTPGQSGKYVTKVQKNSIYLLSYKGTMK